MKKSLIALPLAAALVLGVSACADTSDYAKRKQQQQNTTLSSSLEKANLKKKLERENSPSAVRYVYLMNFGQIVGYYTISGKVSSSGSQLAPEQDIVDPCATDYCPTVVDSAQDDGTYGAGDPGIFFFTTDGVMVETSLDYVVSDAPLAIDVPRLDGK